MIKIVKRYRIKFSYAGIAQYADFNEMENGELHRPSLMVSYAKSSEIPDVSNMTKIADVLSAIKKFAYCGKAGIDQINGMPLFYYKKPNTRKLVSKIETAYQELVESQAKIFFNAEIKPLLIKNKWMISRSHLGIPVPIEKNKEGEWQNVSNRKKEEEFDYLCSVFLESVGQTKKDFKFCAFLNLLPTEEYQKFYVEL